MKKGKRPYYGTRGLLIAMAILALGCQKEEQLAPQGDGEQGTQHKQEYQMEQLGLGQLEDGAAIREALSRLSTAHGNASDKSGLPDIYGFSVDTAKIKAITHGEAKSYTFLAKREGIDGSFFENLVLQRTGEGKLEAFLIRYHTNDGIHSINGHGTFFFEGKRELFPLDVDKLGLGTTARETICYTVVEVWCSYGEHNHPAGDMCHSEAQRTGDGRLYDQESLVCVGAGGGGFPGPDPGDGGGGGGGGSDNPYIITVPANIDLYDFELKEFASGKLFPSERNYYNSDSNIKNLIDGYLIDNGVSNAAMFEAKGHLFFGQSLPLAPQQFVWYFLHRNSSKVLDLKQFLMRQGYAAEALEFALGAIDVWMEDGDMELELEELFLESYLVANPFLLLEIDCDQIPHWQSLAQHTAPLSIQNKINGLQQNHDGPFGDWEIQQLEDANGTIVNLDYFSVNITQFPTNPNTGQPFTPNQFIDYFRRNINDFVDNTTFEPYCEISAICQQETDLWNSNNPLGAIVKLDIPLNDGVVVCADYNNEFWRFMTLEAPWDSNHPVSGTRQFGIEQMANGTYNIYVRGVDRFTSNLQENVAYARYLGNPFEAADDLWESFQNNTNQFINSNSGSSNVNEPVHNRPDWDEVDDVLQGRKSISELGCN
ncbi:hypothetical protein [Flagellimonas sp.]|uniref:hypothetical protein n=1 Tax=Flagellimonas sp. TaxID=2058762 RepID=UPI003AB78639